VGIFVDYYVKRTAEDYSNDLDPQYDAAIDYFTDKNNFVQTYERYDPSMDQEESIEESD